MITLETLDQQIELQAMYRDDKFAAKLKELQTQYKSTQDAQKALDDREKALKEREKLATVILESQETFNEQKKTAEAAILADQQHNQMTKDLVGEDRINVDADLTTAADMKAEAEVELKKAATARKAAETKDAKAEDALQKAEELKAQYAVRLEQLGLKAA